jgi:hypothetical protein
MKWSQAICASILVDSFYARHGLSPRGVTRDVRPSPLAPDWGIPPEPYAAGSRNSRTAGRQASRDSVIEDQTRLTIDS